MKKQWIVVVDDDPISLKIANELLSSDKMKISSVRSGRELLIFLNKNSPDLILLDVVMPEMDGFETYRKLREFEKAEGRRNIPVIFLTGDTDTDAERQGLKLGAYDFIRKPINKDTVLQRIENAIVSTETIENLTEEATVDHLTGLLNRAGSEKKINELCREGKGILAIMDIDEFKLVNDLYGHDMGDAVLRSFAEIIRKNTRGGDVLCRIGGDEFLAFLKNATDKKTADALSGRINEHLTEDCRKLMGEDFSVPIGVSLGCVLIPEEGGEYSTFFGYADKALYQVKQNGKHGCRFYDLGFEDEDMIDASDIDKELLRLVKLCEERGQASNAMLVGQDAFTWIYRFIDRFSMRHKNPVTRILFLLSMEDESGVLSDAMEEFGSVIQKSIRKSDVLMQRKQNSFFLVLPELSDENVDVVIGNIMSEWEKTDHYGKIRVDYAVNSRDYGKE